MGCDGGAPAADRLPAGLMGYSKGSQGVQRAHKDPETLP